jgi:GntR family transcriptional regulator/MocR family aminotransferase
MVLEGAGLRVVPIPVDGNGLRVDMLRTYSALRVVLVTPAHQFPMGVVLARERRQDLIDWARTRNGLILEDDYDAEFRYDRTPIGALQGLAPEHVVLLGSVSKTLSPAVGLGWYVMHGAWRRQLGESVGPAPSTLEQATFAELLRCGAFDRHLRTMRRQYRVRRDLILAALRIELPQWSVGGVPAGLHLTLTPSAGTDLRRLILAARRTGTKIVPLSEYGDRATNLPNSIVVGYGNLADQDVGPAVRSLRLATELV